MQLYGGTVNSNPSVDRHTPIPMWYQLYRVVQNRITVGQLQPNQAIGTEESLAKEYQVARATVRRALSELLRDGWLERREPRKPLVVRGRPVSQEANRVTGLFTEGFASRGRKMTIEVRDARLVYDGNIALQLGLKAGGALVRIARTFRVDSLAVALETAWVPKSLFPELLFEDLTQPLTSLAEARYGIRYSTARQIVRSRLASTEERELLELTEAVVVTEISRLSLSQAQQPIEYMQGVLRGDQYELVMSLSVDEESR